MALDGSIVAANQPAAALFRVPATALRGVALGDVTVADGAELTVMLRSGARTRALMPFSLLLALPDGSTLDCRCETTLFRPSSGGAPAVVVLRLTSKQEAVQRFALLNQRIDALSVEIGRRRVAEASMQALAQRLSLTLASIGDAVITTDDTGTVNFINGVAEQLLGMTLEEARGALLDDVFEIVNEETKEPVESPYHKVMRTGTVVGMANHTALRRRDGSEIPIEDSGAPIRNSEGRIIGIILVFHDVSERYALERELRRKTRALEETDRRKDEFLSMLAHELRNPLAPLSAGVRLLSHPSRTEASLANVAAMMDRQVKHMARLVDDLLDVARLARGSIELRLDDVDLAGVLDQAIEMSQPSMARKGIVLESPRVEAGLWMRGDRARLVQVFSNLLSNAVKFTDAGGTVAVEALEMGGGARFVVRDSGHGIDRADLPHIFDLFTQGKRSLDRSEGGLGIGLTVVRALVEMHGGSVTASSGGPGQGSEFAVWLPCLPAPSGQAPEQAAAPPALLRRAKVLVVDDNIDAAEALAMVVRSWGYEVRVAHSAEGALELQQDFAAGAVLLDIGLPRMSGYAVAARLREASQGTPLLIVAVTGYGSEAAREQSRKAGIDHHLTKPVELDRLEVLLGTLSDAG